MVVRKSAVDLGVDCIMLARQPLDKHVEDRSCGAIPRIPADAIRLARKIFQQAVRVSFADVDVLDRASAAGPIASGRSAADRLDFLAEDRAPFEEELEAVVVCWIVASGN